MGNNLSKLTSLSNSERLKDFLDWVNMGEDELWRYIDRLRDLRIWEKREDKVRYLKDSILNHINDPGVDEARLEKSEDCDFIITPSRKPQEKEDRYVLIGRGHVDPIDWKTVKRDGSIPSDKEYVV